MRTQEMQSPTSHPIHASPEHHRNTSEISFESQNDAAQYIAALVMELRQIAKSVQLDKVASSLEQAYYDAFNVSSGKPQQAKGSPAPGQPARRTPAHNG